MKERLVGKRVCARVINKDEVIIGTLLMVDGTSGYVKDSNDVLYRVELSSITLFSPKDEHDLNYDLITFIIVLVSILLYFIFR